MTPRGAAVRSGGSTRRDAAGALIAAELRLQAARDEAHELRRALIRLRDTVRVHLQHPTSASCAAVRYELSRGPLCRPEAAA